MSVSLSDLSAIAEDAIGSLPAGPGLEPVDKALVRFTVLSSCTLLARDDLDHAIDECFDSGASLAQVTEMLSLASGLGVHSLMAAAKSLFDKAALHNLADADLPLTQAQHEMWAIYVGNDPFWNRFEAEMPGFLPSLLKLSPELFEGFFQYCAIPWKTGQVRARTKELAAMACDATPSHRFEPGFRVHLANAVDLGASPMAIRETLAIAAALPLHSGYASR